MGAAGVARHMMKDNQGRLDIAGMAAAESTCIAKTLKAKTVSDGNVTE